MESSIANTSPWQIRHTTVSVPALEAWTTGPWDASGCPALEAAKEKIAPLEASRRWELIKKMVNPYELVYTHEDTHFHPSLALLKPLSRSYFKMLELLGVLEYFERLPKNTVKLRTAHVAEGPGGFIQAFLDLAERNKRQVGQCTAMTLKPTDSHVPGWRRAAAYLHHHREIKLHYGADGTGDVYQIGNQDSFCTTAGPGVSLFTADGGFDFSLDYSIQEQRVFHLLLCSASIGIRVLARDGCMILKFFDMFSESTQALAILLGRCFREWQLYKPALSRPCNSERYFLGRGFKGCTPAIQRVLLHLQRESLNGRYPTAIASIALPEEISYLQTYSARNTQEQLTALQRAEQYAAHPEEWYTNQLPKDFEVSQKWCQRYRIPTRFTKPVSVPSPISSQELRESTSGLSAAPRSQ